MRFLTHMRQGEMCKFKVLATQSWWPEFDPFKLYKEPDVVGSICNPSLLIAKWDVERGEWLWSWSACQPGVGTTVAREILPQQEAAENQLWRVVLWLLHARYGMLFQACSLCLCLSLSHTHKLINSKSLKTHMKVNSITIT